MPAYSSHRFSAKWSSWHDLQKGGDTNNKSKVSSQRRAMEVHSNSNQMMDYNDCNYQAGLDSTLLKKSLSKRNSS